MPPRTYTIRETARYCLLAILAACAFMGAACYLVP
jgi:hypothetical protein